MRIALLVGCLVLGSACSGDSNGGVRDNVSGGSGTASASNKGHASGGNSGATSPGGSSSGNAGSHSGSGGHTGMPGAKPNGEGTSCSPEGAKRACCNNGMQTCAGGEFSQWGPCLDSMGNPADCTPPSSCDPGEFGPACDAGMPDAGHTCDPGEFGPGCDAGPPPPPPPPPALCTDPTVSNEPEILAAFSPASGETVALDGQIKVWVTDECPAFIAPNEQVDAMTGMVTMPGDRTAAAADGYLDEPALYIAPMTAPGGTPHFPQFIKGAYNNMPPSGGNGGVNFLGCILGNMGSMGPAIDMPPPGTNLSQTYNTEFIWNVKDLGLTPGTYVAEFVIHDGDKERAVGCINIVVVPVGD